MNNLISISQWNELMNAIDTHVSSANQPDDVLYRGSDITKQGAIRHFCYDNYDRIDSPGLDLSIKEDSDIGILTVYNASERARAPITFEQGMTIARNFLNDEGSMMAEEIVCDWVMDGNQSVF